MHLVFADLLLNLASSSLLEFCNKPAGQFWEACKAMGQIYISILIEMYKQIVRESMILMPRNSQNRPKSCPVAFRERPWKQVGSRLRFANALRMLPVNILGPLGRFWVSFGAQLGAEGTLATTSSSRGTMISCSRGVLWPALGA